MWDSGLKYGKIADLFSKLNYNSTRGGTARPYSDLTNKTLKHRKDFIKNILDERDPPTPFPHHYDDPDAQLCASNFLHENLALFENDSPEEGKYAYPADNAEVINLLSKIICTQDVMFHRNQLTAEARKVNKGEDTIAVVMPESKEEVEADPTASPPPSKAKSTVEDEMSHFEEEILPKNIKINLDAAYPLDPNPPFTESDWVFETGSHWPEELQSFTFRWLHEHKAYQLHPSGDHVRNFVTALKKQIGLPLALTQDQETRIYNKSHKYLSSWIKTWQQCGLLVWKGDILVRHRDLEKQFTIRRSEYIAVVQDGRLEGPGMLTPTKGRSHASLKRTSEAEDAKLDKKRAKAEPEFQVLDDFVEQQQQPKPPTIARRSFGPPPIQAPQPYSPHPFHHHSDTTHAADPFSSLYPPRTTSSPFEPLRNQLPSRNGSPAIGAKPATPTPSSIEDTMPTDANGHTLPFRYVPQLPPGNSGARLNGSRSNSRQSLPPQKPTAQESSQIQQVDVSRQASTSFTPPVATPSERPALPTPSPQPQTPATPDVQPGQVKPSVPTLFLIVEKAEGALNAEHPLGEIDMRDSTLAEFFEKVTSRRVRPEESFVRLRFVQRWGAKASFGIDRNASEEEWKKLRADIRRNFQFQSEKKVAKTRFEVYVICETDGQSSDEEEEY